MEAATNRAKEDALLSAKSFLDVHQGNICVYLVFFQSNSKLKLVRSLAVCEESSAPFADGPLETQVGPL